MLTTILPRVLLVDDDDAVSIAITALLKGHHVHVERAESELDAITRLATDDYHVIIIDVKLVGRIGLTLLAKLHDAFPQLVPRIVVITADDRVEVEQQLRQIGICGVIPKPVELDAILAAVLTCLDPTPVEVN